MGHFQSEINTLFVEAIPVPAFGGLDAAVVENLLGVGQTELVGDNGGCHSSHFPEGSLVLSGELTTLLCESYENLVPLPVLPEGEEDRDLVGKLIRENYPKTGHAEYLPPKSLGSHTSLLVGLLSGGTILPDDPEKRTRVSELLESHKKVRLTPEELLRITNWMDTNCQYYGSYFGRRHIRFQKRRDFRPVATFRDATGRRELPLEVSDTR